MRAFAATIRKELLELRRDRAGVMVLLVMPMALVLIVSLVQDNIKLSFHAFEDSNHDGHDDNAP